MDLVGQCFNCLDDDHIKADCHFPLRCRTCHEVGHRARNCPFGLPSLAGAKRGRTPVGAGSRRWPSRRRASPARWRAERGDTIFARSASTGRSPSVPRCCAPSPGPVDQPPVGTAPADGTSLAQPAEGAERLVNPAPPPPPHSGNAGAPPPQQLCLRRDHRVRLTEADRPPVEVVVVPRSDEI